MILPSRVAAVFFSGFIGTASVLAADELGQKGAVQSGIEFVKIGHIAPLTGAIAHLGKDDENGARLAVDEINARGGIKVGDKWVKLELVSLDDRDDPKEGTAAAQKLVDAGVVAVVGHLTSGTSIPASRIYAGANVTQITPSATNPTFTNQGFKTTFRMVANDTQQGAALAKYAATTMGATKVAIIDDHTPYGAGLADLFEKAAKEKDIKVVAREATSDKATDFIGVLTSVRAAKPDVIMFAGMDATAALFAKQMKQFGILTPMLAGDGACSPEFIRLAGDAASVLTCSMAGEAVDKLAKGAEFKQRYKAKFGSDIQVSSPYSYDAVYVIADAIRRAGKTDRASVTAAMAATDYLGLTGKVAFDAKGNSKNAAISMFTVKDGKLGYAATIPAPVQSNFAIVDVFFGTDRRVDENAALTQRFTNARGSLVYGVAKVSVPVIHTMGEIERPKWYKLELSEDPEKHMIFRAAQILSPQEYFGELKRQLTARSQKKAFVFVHGYNVSFEDAALRTAQMAVDLKFSGLPIFYSWPSQGRLARYPADEATNEWTEANLRQFLEQCAANANAQEIYIVAHSMGARATSKALLALFRDRPNLRRRFQELIVAAPDIDADIFKRDIVPRFAALSFPLTLYASSVDTALAVSKKVHIEPRAGDSNPPIVLVQGLETVDASNVDTSFLGHAYFSEERVLLTDISLLIERRMRAGDRPGLQKITTEPITYWRFQR